MMTRSLVMILPLLLTQCATLTSGTSQSVLVDILNAQGATCRGTDNKGRQYVWHETPASTTVHKGDGPMTLVCQKEGFKKATMQFDEEVTNATFGNILLGGGIGLVVDIASGAAQEYPSRIQLVMEPVESAEEAVKNDYKKWKTELDAKAKKAEETEK